MEAVEAYTCIRRDHQTTGRFKGTLRAHANAGDIGLHGTLQGRDIIHLLHVTLQPGVIDVSQDCHISYITDSIEAAAIEIKVIRGLHEAAAAVGVTLACREGCPYTEIFRYGSIAADAHAVQLGIQAVGISSCI